MRGRGLGSLVGGVGGLVFVLVNAGGLPADTVLRGAGVALFVVTVVVALRARDDAPPPGRAALRTYGLCVLAEVLAIPLGAAVLRGVGREELVPVWVVLVLGVHFVPFAWAFGAPVFAHLGWSLVALAVVGGALCVGLDAERGPAAVATAAGFVLLAFSIVGATRPQAAPPGRAATATLGE